MTRQSIGNQWGYEATGTTAALSQVDSLYAKYPALKAYNDFWSNPVMQAVSLVAKGVQFYHGYKRNNSVLWGIGWGLLPIAIGVPLALAQGFGKRK